LNAPVVMVSGAGGGIGRATVGRFAAAGWRVAALDLDRRMLASLEDPAVIARLHCDVRSAAACRAAVAQAVASAGRIDALVNAAGVWREGPVEECSEADFDAVVDVNLKGTFFAIRAAIPALIETKGSVVAISSDYGLVGGPGAAIYCASKFGVNGIVRSVALELASHGVRVNSVCPCDVDTPMLAGQARDYGGGDERAYFDALLAHLPQGGRARFITPEEIAAAVWYLASPEAAPITGVTLPIEWGVTAGY